MKIIYKLIAGYIIFILLIWFVGFMGIKGIRNSLQNSIIKRSQLLTNKIIDDIDKDIYSKIEIFEAYCNDLTLIDFIRQSNKDFSKFDNVEDYIDNKDKEWTSAPKERITPFMDKLLKNRLSTELKELTNFYAERYGYTVFGEVFVTNKYGANIAQTGKTSDYKQNDELWWNNAKEKGIYVENVKFDDSANMFSINIAIPVKGENDSFLGAIKVVLNIQGVIESIKKIEQNVLETDRNLFMFKLIANDGRLIYQTKEFEILNEVSAPSDFLKFSKSGNILKTIDRGGKQVKVLCTYCKSEGYKTFKGLGWIIILEQDTNEIFSSEKKVKNGILIILAIVTFVAILISIFIVLAQKKAQNKIVKEKEKAEYASKAKSLFLAHMSHELRTPLNSILGFSQLLAMDMDKTLTNIQTENVDRINASGTHLLKLIDEILDLSRIEADDIQLSFENVSLYKLTQDVLVFTTPFKVKHGIQIINEITKDNDVLVKADKTRLKQVILNFVTNAIKYNSKNGTITISLQTAADNRARYSVKDTGAGIPADKHAELFEPFNRLDADKTEIRGIGLGLAIAKKLTTLMNGSIGMDSAVGKGSCFYIELPISETITKPENLPADKIKHDSTGELKRDLVILHIEDNQVNQEVVSQMLGNRENINLIIANDAETGIKLAIEHNPDLILMDMHLPGMSGLEAFKQLQRNNETRNIPVIAISANAMQDDIKKALDAGFKSYLTKPASMSNILKEIDKFTVGG